MFVGADRPDLRRNISLLPLSSITLLTTELIKVAGATATTIFSAGYGIIGAFNRR